MDKEQILHKEIDLIQDCIKRMAHNSFIVKGWTISLVAGLLVLSFENSNAIEDLILIPIVFIVCLWILDAKYLKNL